MFHNTTKFRLRAQSKVQEKVETKDNKWQKANRHALSRPVHPPETSKLGFLHEHVLRRAERSGMLLA